MCADRLYEPERHVQGPLFHLRNYPLHSYFLFWEKFIRHVIKILMVVYHAKKWHLTYGHFYVHIWQGKRPSEEKASIGILHYNNWINCKFKTL